jgi:hypothetical protein
MTIPVGWTDSKVVHLESMRAELDRCGRSLRFHLRFEQISQIATLIIVVVD